MQLSLQLTDAPLCRLQLASELLDLAALLQGDLGGFPSNKSAQLTGCQMERYC